MATAKERYFESVRKELEKYNARLARTNEKIEKNVQKCEKLGCNDWTEEEWDAKREILFERGREVGSVFLQFDNEILSEKQNSALWDKFVSLKSDKEDLEESIERMKKIFEKAEAEMIVQAKIDEAFKAEYTRIDSIEKELLRKKAAEEYEAWVKKFKKEAKADGITVNDISGSEVRGLTPKGKKFGWIGNDGWTTRSDHCYSLWIEDKGTIFTSGLFYTCYKAVKNN